MKKKALLRKKKAISKMERNILKRLKFDTHMALGLAKLYHRVSVSKNAIPQRYFSWVYITFDPDTYELGSIVGPMSARKVAHMIATTCIEEIVKLSIQMEDESFVDNLSSLIDEAEKAIISNNYFDYGEEE